MSKCQLCTTAVSAPDSINCTGKPTHRVCLPCARTCGAASIAQGTKALGCFGDDDCTAGYLPSTRDKFLSRELRDQLARNSRGQLPAAGKASALRKLEEDLTKAMMRKCPGCRKPFVRSDGCPEMKCSSCELQFCYLCTAAPRPRNHFQSGECFGPSGAEEDMRAKVKKIWEDGVARMTSAADKRAAEKLKPFA